jgi:hypothetical protein
MATGKRNYWLKLREDFLNGETVDFMMQQKDGANYVVLYEMLCMKCLNSKGELTSRIGEILIPFDVEKIQRDCKWFNIDTVRFALELYKRLGLIYVNVEGNLQISNFDELVGSATDYANQKQAQRIAKSEIKLLDDVDNVHSDVHEIVHTDIRYKDTRYTDTKEKKKDNNTCAFFDNFWSAYPKKVDKEKAQRSFGKLKVDKALFDLMIKAIESQKKSKQWSDKQFIPMPTTWLNNRRWEAELEETKEEESAGTSGRYLRDNGDGTFTACTR